MNLGGKGDVDNRRGMKSRGTGGVGVTKGDLNASDEIIRGGTDAIGEIKVPSLSRFYLCTDRPGEMCKQNVEPWRGRPPINE